MNVTRSGLSCQPWFSSDPHPQTLPENVFPEMKAAGNKCRNPGGTEALPWCYTTDASVRWQHCDIQPCGEYINLCLIMNLKKVISYYECEMSTRVEFV